MLVPWGARQHRRRVSGHYERRYYLGMDGVTDDQRESHQRGWI
jgi:hypothetical protein